MPEHRDLRTFSLGSPGELQDELNALVLAGEKVATAGLLEDYVAEDEAVEEVGEHQALVDADGQVLAIVEITRVETVPFAEVSWEFAQAEGEGFTSVEHWREAHHAFWTAMGSSVTDHTRVVCVWFEVVDGGG